MLECFDTERSVIEYKGHEIPVGVEHFVSILGLKNEGLDVGSVLNRANPGELMAKFGFKKNTKYSEMEGRIRTLEPESDEFKACLLLYIVGTFLFPMSTVTTLKSGLR